MIYQEIREILSNFSRENSRGSVSDLIVFGRQNRLGESYSDQSERNEQKGVLCTLQDERSASVETIATARGLYVQDQFKRNIFCAFSIK